MILFTGGIPISCPHTCSSQCNPYQFSPQVQAISDHHILPIKLLHNPLPLLSQPHQISHTHHYFPYIPFWDTLCTYLFYSSFSLLIFVISVLQSTSMSLIYTSWKDKAISCALLYPHAHTSFYTCTAHLALAGLSILSPSMLLYLHKTVLKYVNPITSSVFSSATSYTMSCYPP